MPITLDQVRRILDADEPNYTAAARLGPQLLPHLGTLIRGRNPNHASKATYLASLIPGDRSVEVLRAAARNPSPVVRAAVASGTRNIQHPTVTGVLMALLDDADRGVRKLAIKASTGRGNATLLAKIADLSMRDASPVIRTIASRAVSEMRGRGLA